MIRYLSVILKWKIRMVKVKVMVTGVSSLLMLLVAGCYATDKRADLHAPTQYTFDAKAFTDKRAFVLTALKFTLVDGKQIYPQITPADISCVEAATNEESIRSCLVIAGVMPGDTADTPSLSAKESEEKDDRPQ